MIESRTPLSADAVGNHYDQLDLFYRDVWGEHVHHGLWLSGRESSAEATRNLVDRVAARAGIQPGDRVCDVGCGYGATARLLATDFHALVTALTISEAQHDYAVTHHPSAGNPRYLFADWLENTLPSASFDALIAVESSEHMADKTRFFSEAARVLRPGGRAVICAWLSADAPSRAAERWLLEPICQEGRMPGMGTEADYRQLFERAGFTVDSFEDVTAQVKRTWPICVWRFLVNLCRKPAYARFLFDPHQHNRIFGLTIFRIWLAYNLGAMRYGIFTAHRPGQPAPAGE